MKKNLVAGVIALLPIGLTVLICWFIIAKLGGILGAIFKSVPVVSLWPVFTHKLLGFLGFLIITYIIGAITTSYIGRKLFSFLEAIITRIPFIRPIYSAGRKLTDALFINKSAFKSVVLVEFPRKGIYSMGFLTNETPIKTPNSSNSVSVFIPTAPNLSTGFYVIASPSELTGINLSVDAALRTIVSGGIISPTYETLSNENKPTNVIKK